MSWSRRLRWLTLGLWLSFGCGGDGASEQKTRDGSEGGQGGAAGEGMVHQAGQADAGEGSSGDGGTGGDGGTSGRGTDPRGDGGGESGTSGGGGIDPVSPDAVVALRIEPGGVLLTPDAPARRLSAVALDAGGNAVNAEITWTTNDPDAVTVDARGVVRAEQRAGSALITATVGDATATVFAVAAVPVEGAVVVSDADVVAGPFAEEPDAAFSSGYRYSIELAAPTPDVGAVLLTSGDKPVVGRVAAVDGQNVTLEVVPLEDVFSELEIDETIALEDAPDAEIPSPSRAFQVGPFQCEAERGVVSLEFPKSEKRVTGLDTLTYELVWTRNRKKVEVRGKPGVAFEVEPTLGAALQAGVECKVILKEYPIPIPGPAKLFLGAAVVVGAGVELAGSIPVAGVGVNLKGAVSAALAMGASCEKERGCSTLAEIDPEGEVTPTLVAPEVSVQFEPEAQAFVYAEFEGGARFTSTLRTEAIQAQAGVKLAGTFATEETQAADDSYVSKYELTLEAEVGPGQAVDDFFKLIGFGLSFLKFEKSIPLASSPAGGKVFSPVSDFEIGDTVPFEVSFDAASVTLPVFGYNVAKVRIYRRETRADGSTALVLANEQEAEPGQTKFRIPWVATVDGSVSGNFLAFVTTELVGLPLEVGAAFVPPRAGFFKLGTGDMISATDSYTVELPAGHPAVHADGPSELARVYYSAHPNGVLVCSTHSMLGGSGFISLNFLAANGLTPGTYTYADWWVADEVKPGTFCPIFTSQQRCIDTPAGPICECALSDIVLPKDFFTGGELVLTKAEDGVLEGTFTLEGREGGASGSFSVPICPKALDLHTEVVDGNFECVIPPSAD